MNQTVKAVRDYYNSGYNKRQLDTDILTVCVDNLSIADINYIEQHMTDTLHNTDEQYKFFMQKLLSRYDDVIAGRTRIIDNSDIGFTKRSSIIELCVDANIHSMCVDNGLHRISDLSNKELVAALPIQLVTSLMASLLVFGVDD